eukprot:TRINITY_DN7902_c0_g1_i1.p1 TRINITY_DN7902_c0_g1~~TRINITY_DN7902_c0_g1_i1.p1  ORF type:complete len:455 (+),score=81.41 TRINITY_DN7902_c0_g1_i1:86-1450(+)
MDSQFSPASCAIKWQWQSDNGWEDFNPITGVLIESAYISNQPKFDFQISKTWYTADFNKMKQINQKTQFGRKIRRLQYKAGRPKFSTNFVDDPMDIVPNPPPIPPILSPSIFTYPSVAKYPPTVSNPPVNPFTTIDLLWEYEKDKNWIPFDKQVTRLLEGTISSNGSMITLNFGVWSKSKGGFVVEFGPMTLTEKASGTVYRVRRYPPLPNKSHVLTTSVSNNSSYSQQDDSESDEMLSNLDQNQDKKQTVQALTKWKVIENPPNENCTICLELLSSDKTVQLSECADHYFHENCIIHCFKDKFLICPNCTKIYGTRVGTQPPGTMTVKRHPPGAMPLTGYESIGTIQIQYHFPSGKQGPHHPTPGADYYGTSRTAYLPDNKEGNEVLKLLSIAWERKLVFRVGTSVTTGKPNCVIWNGVHHKTATSGSVSAFGYPDPTYFERVKAELADLGVK